MNARVISLAFLMLGLAISLGGVDEGTVDTFSLTDNASASCTSYSVGDLHTGCIEQIPCQIQDKWPCIE